MKETIKTLPAKYYHDADIYAAETENIFKNEWLLIGHEAALDKEGSYLAKTIAGYAIFVIRDKDGSLKAYHNVCRHRASPLLDDGIGRTSVLRCPYHGWVYNTDGQLKKIPDFADDKEIEQKVCDRTHLFKVHVRSWRKLVFICMAEGEAPDFDKSLGDLPAACEGTDIENFFFHSAAKHELKCNWKTYVENYMEGYHIPTIHPELNKEVDMETYFVYPEDRIARHVTDTQVEDGTMGGLWVWLWPYAALNIYKEGMNLELMVPTGPETVELHYAYFFRDLENADEIKRTIAASKSVTQEDIDVCERVQKNLASGIYDTGELSPRHEGGLAYFQKLVKDSVG